MASSEDIHFDASDVKAPSKDISATTDAPAAASVAAPAAVPAPHQNPLNLNPGRQTRRASIAKEGSILKKIAG
jgi:hypothetical protein